MKKLTSILLASCFIISAFSGCSGSNNQSGTDSNNIKMEDLPYGSTLVDDKTNYNVRVQYDKRFFNEGMLKPITDYYYSIADEDEELYASLMIPYFDDYMKAVSNDNETDTLTTFQNSYSSLYSSLGGAFTFKMIDIVDCDKNTLTSDLKTVFETMDNVYTDKGEGKSFTDSVVDYYTITVDFSVYCETEDYSTTIEDDTMFIFLIDDEYKLIF